MRNEVIQFKGIARAAAAQTSGAGACEELINLRYRDDKLAVVARHKAIFGNVNYESLIAHTIGGETNYIAVIRDPDTLQSSVVYLEVIYGDDEEIITPAYTSIYNSAGALEVKALNNMLIITDSTKDNLIVYHYDEQQYKPLYDGLPVAPELTITKVDYEDGPVSFAGHSFNAETGPVEADSVKYVGSDKYISIVVNDYGGSELAFRDTFISALKGVRMLKEEFCEGYVLISTTFTLINGEETKSSNPILVEVGSFISKPYLYDVNDYRVSLMLQLQKLEVTLNNVASLENFKDLVKAVNIYASLPLSHYALDRNEVDSFNIKNVQFYDIGLISDDQWGGFKQKKYTNTELDNVLLYRCHSISIPNLGDKVIIKFGQSQATEKTMKVDSSGWLKTTGRGYIYNSRLHLYNYSRTFTPEAGIFNVIHYTKGVWNKVVNAQFKINTTAGGTMYVSGTINALIEQDVDGYKVRLADLVAFPDSRAESLYIYFTVEGVVYAGTLLLEPSKAYNYAFTVTITSTTEYSLLCSEVASADVQDNQYDEEINSSILVSSIGAPYHFPVEHSYPMPGSIRALSVMASQISEAQQGQYPLFVFTSEGIYALQQGTGIVLYSNIIPISNDICESNNVVQTRTGIAYVANGVVNILYGRTGVNISSIVEGVPDFSIRLNSSFVLATQNLSLYNISYHLSNCDF